LYKLHGDAAWRSYDEAFRKLRESLDLPWQKPVEELQGKAIALANKPSFGQPFRGKQAGKTMGSVSAMPITKGQNASQLPAPS
jgi:hypothetical protein